MRVFIRPLSCLLSSVCILSAAAALPARGQVPWNPDVGGTFGLGIAEQSPNDWVRSMSILGPAQEPHYPAGTVSVEELRHPLPRRAAESLARLQAHLAAGKLDLAEKEAERAFTMDRAVGPAHSMLGTEYLKRMVLPQAVDHLGEGVRLLPHDIPTASNLAYAYYLSGRTEDAVRAGKHAVDLAPREPKPNFVLALALDARNAPKDEVVRYLEVAARELPSAKEALASYRGR